MILPLKDDSKIYVAIPYSKVNKKLSFRLVNWICAELSKDGHYIFSPITQGHAFAQENTLPTTWEYWEKLDTEFITWSDVILVILYPGAKESTGVQAEIKIAESLGRRVIFFDPTFILEKHFRFTWFIEKIRLKFKKRKA